ncbi:glycosyltransferase family 4 protein [Candidatus Woesearchaeota archaeon]|nr:glycosyltransferase family 4 protein [Candidatus Woesearchaeota archaeon]
MNILFVIENYLPHIGGVEVVFRNLAEGLVKRGHTATIITHRLKGTAAEETINGVKVKRVSCFGSRELFTFFSIPAAIASAKKADIVHTTTFNGFFPAWVAAKFARKPLIVTVHEVWVGKWREYTDFNPVKVFLHDMFERFLYLLPAVDKYVAVSNSTRQQLLRIGKKNAITIYNGVDYGHFNPKKYSGEKIRKKYSLQNPNRAKARLGPVAKGDLGNYVLLVYGRPGTSKGIEHAITAMKDISQKIPNARMMLLLSRDKQYAKKYSQLMQLIKKLQLEGRIINVEPVAHSELPSYIKAADCVVVPSISEGFGYTAAEAAAMGKPIVASNTTSLPEVVSGKHILVEPNNSMEIADAVVGMFHGKCHRTKLRKFTIEENVRNYLSAYTGLLYKKL